MARRGDGWIVARTLARPARMNPDHGVFYSREDGQSACNTLMHNGSGKCLSSRRRVPMARYYSPVRQGDAQDLKWASGPFFVCVPTLSGVG